MLLKPSDKYKNYVRLKLGGHSISSIARALDVFPNSVRYALEGRVIKPGNKAEEYIVKLLKDCPEL